MMEKKIYGVIPITILVLFCIGGFLFVKYVTELPFVPTNEAFHKKNASFNLDFLIPAGVYLNDRITIGEVIKIRFQNKTPFYESWLRAAIEPLPPKFRYLAALVYFFFWSFLFMTFLRVFTILGYSRALRISLLLGGISYYFMPDFYPGRGDDWLFIAIPLLIIIFRAYVNYMKKKR